jgi:endonuclease/exonuclease/phosphatase family metal-dependent hydrolase
MIFVKLALSGLLSLTLATTLLAQQQASYTLVVYNVENLFDADGVAVFDDYKPDVYTPSHVFTKINNMVDLMLMYNSGKGPDVLVLSEVESDHTQPQSGNTYNEHDFLNVYSHTSLSEMLGNGFNEEIKDLPSELLLLKGFYDAGVTDYKVISAYDPLNNGKPTHVQKNVILTRLPVQSEKTRSHSLLDARPILEVWLDVEGHDLVVFANHWKSRASDAEIEKVRVQNATVLRNRIDNILAENPNSDFILGGDFNSDYNQSYRYPYMEVTGVNDVLKSVGDEHVVAHHSNGEVYNLWYEYDITRRGSDTFRGYWGTLMQIMISPGLYDKSGVSYIDNSFDVLSIPGVNVYAYSGAPIRWSSAGEGYGYSDHLPISMRFTVNETHDVTQKIELDNPSLNDDRLWNPIPVRVTIPTQGQYLITSQIQESLQSMTYFDQLFLVVGTITQRGKIVVNSEIYDLYSPVFDARETYSEVGKSVRLFGRLGLFRGNWQFVIDSEDFILD